MGEDRNPHPPGILKGGSEQGPARTARTGVQRLPREAGPWLRAYPAFPGNGCSCQNVPNPAAWVTSSSPRRRRVGTRPTSACPRPQPRSGGVVWASPVPPASRPNFQAHPRLRAGGEVEPRSPGQVWRQVFRTLGETSPSGRYSPCARCRQSGHHPPTYLFPLFPLGFHLQSFGPVQCH